MTSIANTSAELPELRDIWFFLRRHLEVFGAVGTLALVVWKQPAIAANFSGSDPAWNIGAYYSAIFGWASIQGAFLFGVYAFFLSRSEPFIQAIADSAPFLQLRRYVIRTLYLTLVLTVAALPMLVAPLPLTGNGVGYLFFSLFSVATAYTFFCFLKVIRVFGKIERPR